MADAQAPYSVKNRRDPIRVLFLDSPVHVPQQPLFPPRFFAAAAPEQ